MTTNNKSSNTINFLRNGWIQIRYNKIRLGLLILFSIVFILCWQHAKEISSPLPQVSILDRSNGLIGSILGLFEVIIQTFFPNFSFPSSIKLGHIITLIVYILLSISYIMFIRMLMTNPKANLYNDNFQRAGLTNAKGETPIFLYQRPNQHDPKSQIAVFFPNGTDKDIWYKKLANLSNTFVSKYANGVEQKGKVMRVCISRTNFLESKTVLWDNERLIMDDRKIILGKNDFGANEVLDFSITPHIRIGSQSGGGKTTLQKLILAQALQQGDTVLIADMKGVDYTGIWQDIKGCTVVSSIPELKRELDNVMVDYTERRQELIENKLVKVDDFNKKLGFKKYNRILVVIEEASDVLMPDSERKKHELAEELTKIEESLKAIAKMGRFVNINLFVNCQRPDARSIHPDIKSNLGFAICGKADDVLSKIVLDNSEAAERIPLDSVGFFVDGQHHLFQAYYVDNEEEILKDCPKKQ